jgi:hypothetical protein
MESTKSSKVKLEQESNTTRLIHRLAVFTVLAGAGGSIGFTLHQGRHNGSLLLILLFAGWVVAPFIALLLINAGTKRWPLFARMTLYGLMVAVTLGSLVLYSGLWSPPKAKAAFVFLLVPLLTWSVMGVILLAAKLSPSR